MKKGMLRREAVLVVIVACATLFGCASFRGARLYQSGSAALERGDAERAASDLERAADLVPQGSEIQNHLGLAYAELGRDDDALLAFRRAVELDCDNEQAVHNLSVAERDLVGDRR